MLMLIFYKLINIVVVLAALPIRNLAISVTDYINCLTIGRESKIYYSM